MAAAAAAEGGGEAAAAEQAAAGAGAAAGAQGQPRRRPKREEVQEVVDELATEVRRTTLLDLTEKQLRAQDASVSRLLLVFPVQDDQKTKAAVEKEFAAWLETEDGGRKPITGLLVFSLQAGVQFLEGPTELLFEAVAFCNGLASEGTHLGSRAPRAALIGPLRVLYFTELHRIRTMRAWCSYYSAAKAQGQAPVLSSENCSEQVFMTYRKFLLLGRQSSPPAGEDGEEEVVDPKLMEEAVKKAHDFVPTPDEIAMYTSKAALDYLLSYAEFEQTFCAPFHTVLQAELLWPVPPPLSY